MKINLICDRVNIVLNKTIEFRSAKNPLLGYKSEVETNKIFVLSL